MQSEDDRPVVQSCNTIELRDVNQQFDDSGTLVNREESDVDLSGIFDKRIGLIQNILEEDAHL
jgi:hypothetical protein